MLKSVTCKADTGTRQRVLTYLPLGALVDVVSSESIIGRDCREYNAGYNIGHIFNLMKDMTLLAVGATALMLYGANCIEIGSLSLSDYRNQRDHYSQLREDVLGGNGYADKNENGRLELDEMADAYTRMGLGEKVLEGDKFPNPSLEQLSRAKESYESKAK